MFTFDEFWGSLGNSIFGNSSSAANNGQSRLPSRFSFPFLWLCKYDYEYFNCFSEGLTVKSESDSLKVEKERKSWI